MIVLDTDMLTHLLASHPRVVERYRREVDEVVITIMSRIEVLEGRFSTLRKAADGAALHHGAGSKTSIQTMCSKATSRKRCLSPSTGRPSVMVEGLSDANCGCRMSTNAPVERYRRNGRNGRRSRYSSTTSRRMGKFSFTPLAQRARATVQSTPLPATAPIPFDQDTVSRDYPLAADQ
jgi:hypothetical protein